MRHAVSSSSGNDSLLSRFIPASWFASAHRFWQWLTRVDTTDLLRHSLNRGLAMVVILLVLVDIAFIALNILRGDGTKTLLAVLSLPLQFIVFWLNRRGTSYGAWIETLLLVVVTAVGVATFGTSVTQGVVPLALVFPVVAATL